MMFKMSETLDKYRCIERIVDLFLLRSAADSKVVRSDICQQIMRQVTQQCVARSLKILNIQETSDVITFNIYFGENFSAEIYNFCISADFLLITGPRGFNCKAFTNVDIYKAFYNICNKYPLLKPPRQNTDNSEDSDANDWKQIMLHYIKEQCTEKNMNIIFRDNDYCILRSEKYICSVIFNRGSVLFFNTNGLRRTATAESEIADILSEFDDGSQ